MNPKPYREDPHQAAPPLRTDNSIAFELLIPQHRSDYLDGWSHATIKLPASRPASASKYFNFGAVEARAHAAQAQA